MRAIRLPEEIEKRLEALAQATGRTKTFYARQAILDYIGDLEDLYLAEKRLTATRQRKAGAIPIVDLMRELDLKN